MRIWVDDSSYLGIAALRRFCYTDAAEQRSDRMDRHAQKGYAFMQKETANENRFEPDEIPEIKEKVLEIAAALSDASRNRLLESAKALLKEAAV